MLLVVGVIFAGCDITYDIQKDDSVIITIECDEDDVDDFGEDFDFDEGDLDDKDDLEDLLDDFLDENDDLEGELNVKSFKRTKNDDFTLVFEYIPTDDAEDAIENGEMAVGTAQDVLDAFAEDEGYDDDFEDVYDKEFSNDVDDEYYYVFDKNGDELTDKEMEEYFDDAKLTKIKAAYVIADDDTEIFIPGRIELIISPDDSVDIDDDAISFDYYAVIIYKTGASPLISLLIAVIIAALGAGGYFAYTKFFAKKDDEVEVELNVEE